VPRHSATLVNCALKHFYLITYVVKLTTVYKQTRTPDAMANSRLSKGGIVSQSSHDAVDLPVHNK